jgi:hypothetical protein
MESFRQTLSAIYYAMAEAAGGEAALRHANSVLEHAVFSGAVRDPYACEALLALIRDTDPPPLRPERKRRSTAKGRRAR